MPLVKEGGTWIYWLYGFHDTDGYEFNGNDNWVMNNIYLTRNLLIYWLHLQMIACIVLWMLFSVISVIVTCYDSRYLVNSYIFTLLVEQVNLHCILYGILLECNWPSNLHIVLWKCNVTEFNGRVILYMTLHIWYEQVILQNFGIISFYWYSSKSFLNLMVRRGLLRLRRLSCDVFA